MALLVDIAGVKIHLNPGPEHVFIVAAASRPAAPEIDARTLYASLANMLAEQDLEIAHERIFGSLAAVKSVRDARQHALTDARLNPDTPVTFIEGGPVSGRGLSGVILHAVPCDTGDTTPTSVLEQGLPVGRRWQTSMNDYLVLQNLGSDCRSLTSPSAQTEQLLAHAEGLIRQQGFSYWDVARTWFYLDDILGWYKEFNRVRTEAYQRFGLFPNQGDNLRLPASTGISGRGSSGSAIAMDMILARPIGKTAAERLLNPAQKEAFQYGSAFSRAVRVQDPGSELIEISGTAAIDKAGNSLYPGDGASQISCTFDKVEALLSQVGASLHHIAAATVFVKHPALADTFRRIATARGLDDFPAVIVQADICRDELLFEIDAEAMLLSSAKENPI